jgi:hypothetical protein
MKEIDLIYRTMFGELDQRTLDGSFEAAFSLSGNFVKVPVKARDYWYFNDPQAKPVRRYVGPVEDPAISKRVEEFQSIKDDLKSRRKLVSTLTREAGLPAPERLTGDVVEALERAGLFRLRGVLIGTVAFQTYSAYLGVRLPGAVMQTGDADFAQFHSISDAVEDSLPPMVDLLREIDPTFRAVPHRGGGVQSTQFINATNYKVEFLTPNRGSDDNADKPAAMPALGGASAQPLRYLDFLIFQPVRTTMLHRNGVSVLVPSPQRFAVHKFIVASARLSDANGQAKRDKDVRQAKLLVEALALTRRQDDLAEAFAEAWQRGTQWRASIQRGLGFLAKNERNSVLEIVNEGLAQIGTTLSDLPSA